MNGDAILTRPIGTAAVASWPSSRQRGDIIECTYFGVSSLRAPFPGICCCHHQHLDAKPDWPPAGAPCMAQESLRGYLEGLALPQSPGHHPR